MIIIKNLIFTKMIHKNSSVLDKAVYNTSTSFHVLFFNLKTEDINVSFKINKNPSLDYGYLYKKYITIFITHSTIRVIIVRNEQLKSRNLPGAVSVNDNRLRADVLMQ